MPLLTWTDDLTLGVSAMETTHQEFVVLLAAAESAADDSLLPTWAELVDHTREHFANEDRYMQATGFAAGNCHTMQHRMVLEVMEHGLALGRTGDMAPIRQITRELAPWFVQHTDAMDVPLAMHLKRVGFDPASGTVAHPHALPPEVIHGCASESCSPATTHAAAAASIA